MSNRKQLFDTDYWVDQSLKTEPGYQLPGHFADKIVLRVEKRLALQQYLKEFLIYAGAITGVSVLSGLIGYFLITDTWKRWISLLLPNIDIFAGIAAIVFFILFADIVLLRYFSLFFKRGGRSGQIPGPFF